jgi:glycosyltransferase involved in cell wall biosynthesis
MTSAPGRVEIVLPAHNEADSIAATLREFYRVTSTDGMDVSFLVCEDGSTDGTPEVVRALARELPVVLDSSPERRGYSRAVVDGMRSSSADVVGFIDSDGQCDPHDLARLAAALDGVDAVVGYRHPRVDSIIRRCMSRAFGLVFRRVFPIDRRDPSCPYVLIRRCALQRTLRGHPGILPQGFWWEFNARATAAGLSVREVPVHHRGRAAGRTQVYRLANLPRIVADHLIGLWHLRRDMAAISSGDGG